MRRVITTSAVVAAKVRHVDGAKSSNSASMLRGHSNKPSSRVHHSIPTNRLSACRQIARRRVHTWNSRRSIHGYARLLVQPDLSLRSYIRVTRSRRSLDDVTEKDKGRMRPKP